MRFQVKSARKVAGKPRADVRDRCVRLTLEAENDPDQEVLSRLYRYLALRAVRMQGTMGEAIDDLLRAGGAR